MKKIKWLTEKQVQKAAKRGRKTALLCSIKHWGQLSSAGKEQILDLSSDYVCCGFCALCMKYSFERRGDYACLDCGLYCLRARRHRSGAWKAAADAFVYYRVYLSTSSWTDWKWASKALLRRIIKLYEKEYGVYER